MFSLKHFHNTNFDMRVTLYHAARVLFIAAIGAIIIKNTLFDTIRITGDQMSPTVMNGDRILFLRIPFIPVGKYFFAPLYDKPVVFKTWRGLNVLRVAGVSGDVITIDSAKVTSSVPLPTVNTHCTPEDEVIPGEYAPRDFFDEYKIPGKGTTLTINQLSHRDLFFTSEIIRQEQSKDTVYVKAYLLIDDSLHNNYPFSDFVFYTGSIDTVPDSLRNDWFFWYRLEEYLYQKFPENKVSLYFTILLNGVEIDEYTLKNDYYFLIADSRRHGLDSRYFGPVNKSHCFGRALMVLWSHGPGEDDKWHFRFNRIGRFIP